MIIIDNVISTNEKGIRTEKQLFLDVIKEYLHVNPRNFMLSWLKNMGSVGGTSLHSMYQTES